MMAKRVHFEGMVQGVGFRYTARTLSDRYDVTGYVMNLSDGRVELFAQGDESDVNRFIDHVRAEMNTYVNKVDIEDAEPSPSFKQFTVRYY